MCADYNHQSVAILHMRTVLVKPRTLRRMPPDDVDVEYIWPLLAEVPLTYINIFLDRFCPWHISPCILLHLCLLFISLGHVAHFAF